MNLTRALFASSIFLALAFQMIPLFQWKPGFHDTTVGAQTNEMLINHEKFNDRNGTTIGSSVAMNITNNSSMLPVRNSIIDGQATSNDSVVAGCLIIRDDNFRLPEWLAFHYHVLPLHRVVVAIDPRSVESPMEIINQFSKELGMDFLIWHDKDYLDVDQLKGAAAGTLHQRKRQFRFLQKCMSQLQQEGWKWASLWDTDEFILFHHEHQSFGNLTERGIILKYVQEHPRQPKNQDCYYINRILIGAKELDYKGKSGNNTDSASQTYHGLDMRRLQTFRFRYRNDFKNELNGNGKPLLNVQKIVPTKPVPGPHRVAPELCYPSANSDDPFVMYHYLGSWEAYSHRDDYRKGADHSYEAWLYRAEHASKRYDEFILSWFPGFLNNVGLEKATRLLQKTGLDPDYNASHKIAEFRCQRCEEYLSVYGNKTHLDRISSKP